MEDLVDLDLRWISFENLEFGIFEDFVCDHFSVNKGGDIFYQLVRVLGGLSLDLRYCELLRIWKYF